MHVVTSAHSGDVRSGATSDPPGSAASSAFANSPPLTSAPLDKTVEVLLAAASETTAPPPLLAPPDDEAAESPGDQPSVILSAQPAAPTANQDKADEAATPPETAALAPLLAPPEDAADAAASAAAQPNPLSSAQPGPCANQAKHQQQPPILVRSRESLRASSAPPPSSSLPPPGASATAPIPPWLQQMRKASIGQPQPPSGTSAAASEASATEQAEAAADASYREASLAHSQTTTGASATSPSRAGAAASASAAPQKKFPTLRLLPADRRKSSRLKAIKEESSQATSSRASSVSRSVAVSTSRAASVASSAGAAAASAAASSSRAASSSAADSELHTIYRKLIRKLKPRWKKAKYRKRREDRPDPSVHDPQILKEVLERTKEGPAKWDKQYEKWGSNSGFEIDYIVSTTTRELGSGLTKEVLQKFTKYPVPSWESSSMINEGANKVRDEHLTRVLSEDLIEVRLRMELGDDEFERLYPCRYMKYELGAGDGGYIQDARSLHLNHLRAIESSWNVINSRAGLPPLLLLDWTDAPADLRPLMKFKFIAYGTEEESVQLSNRGFNQLAGMACSDACTTCTSRTRGGGVTHCCNIPDSIDIDRRTHAFSWKDEGVGASIKKAIFFECSSKCGCGPRCRNRATQLGRQFPLAIFYEPTRGGWGVRSLQEIEQGAFVTEYLGQLRAIGLPGQQSVYDFLLAAPARDISGAVLWRTRVLSAGEMGNETKYMNHSCSANLEARSVVVESRTGVHLHRISFFANRTIKAGEELVFDYFPGLSGIKNVKGMFKKCCCGAPNCRFPAEKASSGVKVKKEIKAEADEAYYGTGSVDDVAMSTTEGAAAGAEAAVDEEYGNEEMPAAPAAANKWRKRTAAAATSGKQSRSDEERAADAVAAAVKSVVAAVASAELCQLVAHDHVYSKTRRHSPSPAAAAAEAESVLQPEAAAPAAALEQRGRKSSSSRRSSSVQRAAAAAAAAAPVAPRRRGRPPKPIIIEAPRALPAVPPKKASGGLKRRSAFDPGEIKLAKREEATDSGGKKYATTAESRRARAKEVKEEEEEADAAAAAGAAEEEVVDQHSWAARKKGIHALSDLLARWREEDRAAEEPKIVKTVKAGPAGAQRSSQEPSAAAVLALVKEEEPDGEEEEEAIEQADSAEVLSNDPAATGLAHVKEEEEPEEDAQEAPTLLRMRRSPSPDLSAAAQEAEESRRSLSSSSSSRPSSSERTGLPLAPTGMLESSQREGKWKRKRGGAEQRREREDEEERKRTKPPPTTAATEEQLYDMMGAPLPPLEEAADWVEVADMEAEEAASVSVGGAGGGGQERATLTPAEIVQADQENITGAGEDEYLEVAEQAAEAGKKKKETGEMPSMDDGMAGGEEETEPPATAAATMDDVIEEEGPDVAAAVAADDSAISGDDVIRVPIDAYLLQRQIMVEEEWEVIEEDEIEG